MKTLKRIEIITLLLLVTIIIFASFFGVYKKEDFRTVNLIKKYNLGMQFTDKRIVTGTVSQKENTVIYDLEGNVVEDDGETEYTEENGYKTETIKVNEENILTKENYALTKKIIKNRLKGMNVGEYNVDIDKDTGTVSIELQENDEIEEIIEHVEQKGMLTIIDKDTEEVLLNNSDVKLAKVVYGSSGEADNSTIIYLQIDFNKDGAKKLEEISQIYVANTVTVENEDGEDEESEEIKYISVVLDGQTLRSTYFGEKMSTGSLYVPITSANDEETLEAYGEEVNNIATIINNGVLPIEYEFTDEVVEVNLDANTIIISLAIPIGILLVLSLIACIVMVVKFKAKGFIATFLQIGYIAILLLVIRYVNVKITVEGIVGIITSVILNYIFTFIMLNTLKNKEKIEWNRIGKFALYTIPVYVIAIILTFNSLTRINSIGMSLVWGSFVLYIYNLSITKTVLEMLSK